MGLLDIFGRRTRLDLQAPQPVQLATVPKPPPPEVRVVVVEERRRDPVQKVLRELPVYSRMSWETVYEVRGALHALMGGQFGLAAELVDAMEGDDRITGVLSARLDGLLGTPLEMQTPEGLEEDKGALDIAEEARKLWPKMAQESSLREMLRWGRMLGVCPWENIPIAGDPWTRRVKIWHPRYLYWVFDMTRQPWSGSYKLLSGDGVIDLDLDEGGMIRSTNPDRTVELGRFGLYTPFGYQRAWTHGLVRSLAIPWLVRNYAIRDWARYSEIHGIPIRAISVPTAWSDEKERKRAEAEIAALGSDSVIRLPVDKDGKGYKLELIEPKARSEEAFEKLIAKCDTAIAIAILGQNLTTEIGTSGSGSRAAAQVHDGVRDDILRSDAETLSTAAHDHILMQWTEHHHGDAALAPWPRWAVDPPENKSLAAKALSDLSQGVATLRKTQLPIDWGELCERYDIPLEAGVEIPEFTPPAPPVGLLPPAADAGDAGDAGGVGDGQDVPPDGALSRVTLARTRKGAEAGQAYADDLAQEGRTRAAKILAGDVKALLAVLDKAKATKDGKIDGPALKTALLAAYKGMNPAAMARLVEKLTVLAKLQGMTSIVADL